MPHHAALAPMFEGLADYTKWAVVTRYPEGTDDVPLGAAEVGAALVRLDPLEDFAVALALRQFGSQPFGVDSEEFEEALIERTVEVIIAVLFGDLGAALVEHAGQQHVTTEAGAHAARRTLREVGHRVKWR